MFQKKPGFGGPRKAVHPSLGIEDQTGLEPVVGPQPNFMLEVIGRQGGRKGLGRLVLIESAPVPSSQKAGK